MNGHNFIEYFRIAWLNLTHQKKRAYLTIIGIFIGIMAVTALFSLGQGLQQGVNEEFAKLGVDKIFISPASVFGGSEFAPTVLTDNDLRRVQNTRGVKEALAVNSHSARIEWGNELQFQMVQSYPKDETQKKLLIQSEGTDVIQGRQLQAGDTFKAIIGSDYIERASFQDVVQLGANIKVNNRSFEVVGIRKHIGNSGDDRMVFIPQDTYDQIFVGSKNTYNLIFVQTEPGMPTATVAENIKRELRRERHVVEGSEDFTVQTSADVQNSANQVLGIINIVLMGIAVISLIVGAVGIMNTMYTAVLERTKEIGVMKAVGATNEAILTIFLIESGLLGLVGGLVGVSLGLAISFATAGIAGAALRVPWIQAYVSVGLILGGVGFSFLIGALAGFLPARQAAKQKPVDSLRYE